MRDAGQKFEARPVRAMLDCAVMEWSHALREQSVRALEDDFRTLAQEAAHEPHQHRSPDRS